MRTNPQKYSVLKLDQSGVGSLEKQSGLKGDSTIQTVLAIALPA